MGRHHHQQQAVLPFEQIIEGEQTLALRRAQLSRAQQATETAIGFAIRRIGENVRRAIHEDETATDELLRDRLAFLLQFFKRGIHAHDAGQCVAVGDADGGIAQQRRRMRELPGMRGTAQEREIRRDADFRIGGHANIPCRYQRGFPVSRR